MKNRLFPLLLTALVLMLSGTRMNAQDHRSVLHDINLTMKEFMADLSNIYVDKDIYEQKFQYIAEAFGYPEYFIFNGEQMRSFEHWMKTYCKVQLRGEEVEHTMNIKDMTLCKVEPDKDTDRRWSFKASLQRTFARPGMKQDIPDNELNVTVMWNGPEKYVSIVSIDGLTRSIPASRDKSMVDAARLMALLYADKDEEAIEMLRPDAGLGDIDSQLLLGDIYFETKNGEKALHWYTKAAEQEDERGMYGVARIYETGLGVQI